MNLIKQITIGDSGAQTIKMVVKSNERGPQGAQGVPGDAATLEAGNAYSIPEGQNPQVINTGTSSNAVFDFYLPKGPRGYDGKDGKDGKDGEDGAIHYTAGTGINITDSNVIEATGAATAAWGGIQGDIDNQTDLQTALQNTASTAETASKNYTDTKLEGYAKTTDIPTVNDATLTIQNNGTNVATFTANSSTNTTANIVPPVQIGSVLSTPTNVAYVDTANIIDGAVTSAKLDDSLKQYRSGDSVTKIYSGTAVTTSVAGNSLSYIIIQLAKPISTGVIPSITSFEIHEIEKIGNGSSSNILYVQDSGGTTVTMNQTSLSATASIFPGTTDVIIVSLRPKTGYSWVDFQSYMTCNVRTTTFNISFT